MHLNIFVLLTIYNSCGDASWTGIENSREKTRFYSLIA
jgi:hypothetical protein